MSAFAYFIAGALFSLAIDQAGRGQLLFMAISLLLCAANIWAGRANSVTSTRKA